jgi:multiple sugar transport system substrate-binding protein
MRKYIAAAALMVAATIGVSGTAVAKDPVTITFRFNDTEPEVRGAIDAFEKQHPDIKIELQRIGWKDARDQFLREAATGSGPDVAHVAQVWVKEFGEAGAVMPLDDFLKKNPPANGFADFAAQDLAKSPKGQVSGLPWTLDTWALVYRTDLLKQAGIDKLPQTWPELREVSATVYKKTGKTGYGFPAGSSASGAIWFLANSYWWSFGKSMMIQKDDGSYALGLTAADIAEAMNYYKAFLDAGDNTKSNLAASDAHDPSIVRALVSGDQAIGAMPPNTFKQVLDTYAAANPGKPLPFASSPFPMGSATRGSMFGGRMLVINANTAHADAAWTFVKYMATEEVFAKYYRTQFPAQQSLLKKVDFGPELKGFAEQLQYSRSWGPYSTGPIPLGVMWNETGRAFGTALSGQRPPEEAAKDLLQELQKRMTQKG